MVCGPDACSDKQRALKHCKSKVIDRAFNMVFAYSNLDNHKYLQIMHSCAAIHYFIKHNILTHTHIRSALTIGSYLEFGILLKNNSACGPEETGDQTAKHD